MPSKRQSASRRVLAVLALLACTALLAGLTEQASAAPIPQYSLAVSASPDRSSSGSLSGSSYVQPARIHVFTTPSTRATRVRFYLDDTSMARTPRYIDTSAPFDFAGTATDGKVNAFDTSTVSAGTHTITAAVETGGKTRVTSASFTVTAAPPPPPVGDTTRPTPGALSANPGDTKVDLTWTAATDDVGVTRYEVWKDTMWLAQLDSGARAYTVTGLTNGFSADYRVVAYDAAGNYANSNTVSATPSSSATPPPPPTGEPAPSSSKWQLVASDDFNASTLDLNKWKVYGPNWSGHAGNGLRDGRSVSMQNGMLTITAQMLNGVLVSGGVQSRVDQRYGRFEFRVRADADPSSATSANVLTWPTSENWPAEGENNIYETTTASRYPFSSFIHYSPQNLQYWYHHYADGTQWHDMAMEWEPDQIRIYRDGALVFTVNDTYAIPDWSHHLVFQLDALKSWMSGAVRMQVDWVRIYSRAW